MDIWTLLQASAAVSTVGLLIWIIKLLFHDKLDARWHYFIWLVLFVRILVPVSFRMVRTPVSLFQALPVLKWLEFVQLAASRGGFGRAGRIAMLVYAVGAILLCGYYTVLYIVLRVQIAKAQDAPRQVYVKAQAAADRYGLKMCRRIRIFPGAASPYVLGLFRPVLVIPEKMADSLEEKVLLHELLHMKYKDVLVNLGLHALRVLNWFNPFIWYIASVIQNDSEALCDQRVLELCGPESGSRAQEEYGDLLIAMADKRNGMGGKAARIGTSNMANRARDMKIRLRRIVDFTHVPSKVGIVAVCITAMLSVSCIGYASEEARSFDTRGVENSRDLERLFLRAGLYRPQTLSEAVNIYLKALMERNPGYMELVMPESRREAYEAWMLEEFPEHIAGGNQELRMDRAATGPFFPRLEDDILVQGFVYNLVGTDDSHGTAQVRLQYRSSEYNTVLTLELVKEDGWKVDCAESVRVPAADFLEPPLFYAVGEGDVFSARSCFYNRGYYDNLELSGGFQMMSGNVPEEEDFLKEFSMEEKSLRLEVVYEGEEPLEDCRIGIAYALTGTDEEITDSLLRSITVFTGDGSSSSSNMSGYVVYSGKSLQKGDVLQIANGGGGPDAWSLEDQPEMKVWIAVNGEIRAEITCRTSEGKK